MWDNVNQCKIFATRIQQKQGTRKNSWQLDENEILTDLKITTNPKQKKHKSDKDWLACLKYEKHKNCQWEFYAEIAFKKKKRERLFQLGEFIASRQALQEILNEVLQAKEFYKMGTWMYTRNKRCHDYFPLWMWENIKEF